MQSRGWTSSSKLDSDFGPGMLVFRRNENSDLVEIALPPVMEFFSDVFSQDGPFWGTYSALGLASRPEFGYANYFSGRLYFLKNTENRFIMRPGPIKEFRILKGRIEEYTPATLSNLFLLLHTPIDYIKQVCSAALASIRANSMLEEFNEEFSHA